MRSARIGAGRAIPVPGDTVGIATADGDRTGTVSSLVMTRERQQWSIECDDGSVLLVSDRSALTLIDERCLPLREVGGVWRLDVRRIALRRESYSGCVGAGFRGGRW